MAGTWTRPKCAPTAFWDSPFIDQAQGGDELLGAFFEFKNKDVFERLKQARGRGAAVKVLYDGDTQIVIVGSANFSKASTDTNDENMLVIRGAKPVADIYMGEFMRLFTHYALRESLKFKDNTTEAAALMRKHLVEDVSCIDGDRPAAGYYRPGTDRALRRAYFSGG